jgi:AcrR family transcriptional regulator
MTAADDSTIHTARLPGQRVQRSRAKILQATTELLFERGMGGTSVDEISRRSGVAKTTIYRHWATREALLKEACALIGTPLNPPDTGTLQGDLAVLMGDLAAALRDEDWTSVLPSVIDAAERSADIAHMYATLQAGYAKPFEVVLDRGVRRHELSAPFDIPAIIASLVGALFYRRYFSREPLTDEFVASLVRLIIR